MNLPVVYVVDNEEGNIDRLEAILSSQSKFKDALEKFIGTESESIANDEKVLLNSVKVSEFPRKSFLLIDASSPSAFDTTLASAQAELRSSQSTPAILFLDYALQDREVRNGDAENALATLNAYCPDRKTRLWAFATSWPDGGESDASVQFADSRMPRAGRSLSKKGCPGFFYGLLNWLKRNRTKDYESFLGRLMGENHETTKDVNEVIDWIAEYAPIANQLDGHEENLRKSVHDLVSKGKVGLDFAYLLALISLRSVGLGGAAAADEHFPAAKLISYYEADDDLAIFLQPQHVEDRKHTLYLFGELFKRLLVCDPCHRTKCCKPNDDAQKITLTKVELDRKSLEFTFCFGSGDLAAFIQNGARASSVEVNKQLLALGVTIPDCSAPGKQHATSVLLNAFRLALALSDSGWVNSGDNLFGSEVTLRVLEDKSSRSTRIAFRG